MQKTYYIGGSPCAGKSTVAEMLVKKHDLDYYKLDDHLEEYLFKSSRVGKPLSSRYAKMTLDEIWLREPELHCNEEFLIYEEFFEFVTADIFSMQGNKDIVTEGAGLLPSLMLQRGVTPSNYICVVPTNEFQFQEFSKRPWVMHYLSGCSNPTLAFENWMKRDYLFAEAVYDSATRLGYPTLIVDGQRSLEENYQIIEKSFGLS